MKPEERTLKGGKFMFDLLALVSIVCNHFKESTIGIVGLFTKDNKRLFFVVTKGVFSISLILFSPSNEPLLTAKQAAASFL